ncbi:hypothetical protein FHP29_10900 [Nocardioides albidus]|uniref:DUF6318 domain-containing protein n=1 Tax=Nocardioides albidus TaxID=1517589 RepID=A0A5C4VU93_9ACTN|nr:DUF6318 family protein [Nocardioides albidus]TNM39417.1 hypothetical protein FHP29_10900 [Nocardioides albidus]
MGTTIRAALAALVLLLGLVGCGDDAPSPQDPESTWSPTGKMETPTSAADETPDEPQIPDEATKATKAGARAFITYYWELINYAQATGDIKTLRAVSSAECRGCLSGINGIRTLYKEGGYLTGGDYSVDVTMLEKAEFETPSARAFHAQISARNEEQVITAGDGSTTISDPATNDIEVYVLWVADQWRMDVLVIR